MDTYITIYTLNEWIECLNKCARKYGVKGEKSIKMLPFQAIAVYAVGIVVGRVFFLFFTSAFCFRYYSTISPMIFWLIPYFFHFLWFFEDQRYHSSHGATCSLSLSLALPLSFSCVCYVTPSPSISAHSKQEDGTLCVQPITFNTFFHSPFYVFIEATKISETRHGLFCRMCIYNMELSIVYQSKCSKSNIETDIMVVCYSFCSRASLLLSFCVPLFVPYLSCHLFDLDIVPFISCDWDYYTHPNHGQLSFYCK